MLSSSWNSYCWWKKSCTTWHVWNLVNNGIFTISAGEFYRISSTVGRLEIISGQIIIIHQPRFPWNKGIFPWISLTTPPFRGFVPWIPIIHPGENLPVGVFSLGNSKMPVTSRSFGHRHWSWRKVAYRIDRIFLTQDLRQAVMDDMVV